MEEKILEIGSDKIMAFIAEPVVGAAGGALVPPPEYWPMIRDICTRHKVLLIAEIPLTGKGIVILGFGRKLSAVTVHG